MNAKPPPGSSTDKSRDVFATAFICFLLVGITWVAFGQTIHHQFLNYDDNEYVYENHEVARGLSLSGIGWAFTHSYSANWHPLTTISHMLDVSLFGLHPWGHHLTNVVLHALAAVLLFLALRELTKSLTSLRSVWPSAIVAALFAIHPLHVESVAWVSERKDVLSAVFFMFTLLAYARYARSNPRSGWGYTAVILLFAAGLLCKPTLVTVPFVLLLLDYWPLKRWGGAESREPATIGGPNKRTPKTKRANAAMPFGALIGEKIPLFLLSIVSCITTVLAQGEALEATRRITLIERAANALLSYGTYLRQAFYPKDLSIFYPYPVDVAVVSQLVPLFFLLATISVAVFLTRKCFPFLIVGWLWFVGMLVPMIGLIQVGSQAHADRYAYLTQIGLYIAIVWLAATLLAGGPNRRRIFAVGSVVIIGTLTASSHRETSHWRNSETIWRHALVTTAGNYVAHNNLGHLLTLRKDFAEAISHFREAIALKPDYAEAYNNLGNALLDSEQSARRNKPVDPDNPTASHQNSAALSEAIGDYNKALEAKPGFAEAWTNLATAVLQKGDLNEAISHYRKALDLAPDLPEANGNLGNALLEKGDLDEALKRYLKALQLKPDYADAHYGISLILIKHGKALEAMEHLSEVIKLNPDYPEAHHNMGVILAQRGDLDGAVSEYRQALHYNPNYAQVENNLGNALLRQGKFDESIAHLQRAIILASNYAEPYNDLGTAFMQKGQVDNAIASYQKAIQLKQNYAEAHSNLGNAFFQKKDFDKAIEQYKAAVFFNPDSAPMQYNLGNALIAKGNRAEAIACYETALRVEPGYSGAREQLRRLGVPVSD